MKQVMHRTSLVLLVLLSNACFADEVNQEPTNNPAETPVEAPLDYENAFDLAKDFFDISVKKDKGMKYWSRQLMGLIKKKGKLDKERLLPFIREFHNAHSTRDALGIGKAFEKHKDKFKEPKLAAHIDKMIKRDGLNSLLIILKHRMNIKG